MAQRQEAQASVWIGGAVSPDGKGRPNEGGREMGWSARGRAPQSKRLWSALFVRGGLCGDEGSA